MSDLQLMTNELQQYLPYHFGEGIRNDVHTFALAKSYAIANHPRVIHLDFADPDNYGHAGQYDSFLDAGHYLDAMVPIINYFLNEREELPDRLFGQATEID